jgi:hypothetical protein
MTPLRYIVEPERLLMTWQPSERSGQSRLRRIVAEVNDDRTASAWRFRYLLGTEEMVAAQAAGFEGHPAFKLADADYKQGVRETLLRRLPPRNREDFADFLMMHRLPNPFPGSDLALLGYTGAKLPSDGFSFVPVFPAHSDPCEYILEVAGVRHVYVGDLEHIRAGDLVAFELEPSNTFDPGAITVLHRGQKLGYVNRALLPSFHNWLVGGKLEGRIERKNGTPARPLVYVRVCANCPNEMA